MREFLESLGKLAQRVINSTGLMFIMLSQAVLYTFTPPVKFRSIFKQMEFVGVKSLFVVILTGSFTGMVLAYQSFNALKRFGAESLVGPTVALSMARELGPVLTGLMVTGRAGSAMATELGTMRVTEQIDALHTMAVNPIKYLVVPRLLAGIFMLPFLTIVTDFVGVLGGYFVGVNLLDINPGVYMGRTMDYVTVDDIFYGLYKSVVFGLIISLTACYNGFYATGGAEGVGRAATNAVVLGCVLILCFNYIFTSIMI
jgi:phospholipid/cholesterol/gamma-HCH transport system permease protein